jgi:hypothetical protein
VFSGKRGTEGINKVKRRKKTKETNGRKHKE